MTQMLGPRKVDCPCGECGRFGTPTKRTLHVRDCTCRACASGLSVTKPRKRVRAQSKKRTATSDDGWQDARAEAMSRTGGSCEVDTPWCKTTDPHRAHVVHHRLLRAATRGQGADRHRQDLLLVLCSDAHDGIHANPSLAYERGWLLHSWDADRI